MSNISVIFHLFFIFFFSCAEKVAGAFRRISLVLSCLRKESCFATTCIAPQRTKKKPESDEEEGEEEEEHAGGPGEKEEEIKSRLRVFGSRRSRRRRRESYPLIFEEET